jgi:hypothetical protein
MLPVISLEENSEPLSMSCLRRTTRHRVTWDMRRGLPLNRTQYPGWRFNNIQPVLRSAGTALEGMLLIYGWSDENTPTAKAFLLHQ